MTQRQIAMMAAATALIMQYEGEDAHEYVSPVEVWADLDYTAEEFDKTFSGSGPLQFRDTARVQLSDIVLTGLAGLYDLGLLPGPGAEKGGPSGADLH